MECSEWVRQKKKIWMNSHKPSKCFHITVLESRGGEVFPCFALLRVECSENEKWKKNLFSDDFLLGHLMIFSLFLARLLAGLLFTLRWGAKDARSWRSFWVWKFASWKCWRNLNSVQHVQSSWVSNHCIPKRRQMKKRAKFPLTAPWMKSESRQKRALGRTEPARLRKGRSYFKA